MLLSPAEWKVMNAVWELRRATARDVVDMLASDTGWAYTTVKTMMTRLVEKGALKARMDGKQAHYEARLSQAKARKSALASLAERAFDGAVGPMMHFLLREQKLSARDRQALQELLRDEERRS